jgi:hypothetical protein
LTMLKHSFPITSPAALPAALRAGSR